MKYFKSLTVIFDDDKKTPFIYINLKVSRWNFSHVSFQSRTRVSLVFTAEFFFVSRTYVEEKIRGRKTSASYFVSSACGRNNLTGNLTTCEGVCCNVSAWEDSGNSWNWVVVMTRRLSYCYKKMTMFLCFGSFYREVTS